MPCKHTTSVLMHKRHLLHEYIDVMLSKGQFDKVYNYMISLVPHKSFWPSTNLSSCNPPKQKRRIGRSKTKMSREDWENELKRSSTHKCSQHGENGHNIKTCARGPTAKQRKETERRNNGNQILRFALHSNSLPSPSFFSNQMPNARAPKGRERPKKAKTFVEVQQSAESELPNPDQQVLDCEQMMSHSLNKVEKEMTTQEYGNSQTLLGSPGVVRDNILLRVSSNPKLG